jgi:glutamate 5-kinase
MVNYNNETPNYDLVPTGIAVVQDKRNYGELVHIEHESGRRVATSVVLHDAKQIAFLLNNGNKIFKLLEESADEIEDLQLRRDPLVSNEVYDKLYSMIQECKTIHE